MQKYRPNKPNYFPNEKEYVLVFMPIDGIWREVGHDIPKYNNILLADYLAEKQLFLPDCTQFCRVIRDNELFEYRAYDCLRVTIYYCHKDA